MPIAQKVKTSLLKISGYLVPLVQQIPPFGIYHPPMILPLIIYIGLLFSNFTLDWREGRPRVAVVGPLGWFLLGMGVCITGLLFALYSIVYLGRHKKAGLVTTGPYRYVRHPQYTGFLLLTLGLTGWSYWVHKVFCGGRLTPCQTVLLWYAQLGAYIVLALLEESYLSKEFDPEYATYKSKSSFFLPFGNARRYDILLSILGLSFLLFILLIPSPST